MSTIQNVLDKLSPLFAATEEMLNEWKGDSCLQFPALMASVAVKLNLNEKQAREADPLVRFYVRNNPEWHVTRGAHGGIMRVSVQKNKEEARAARAALKEQMKATIENSVAAATSAVSE